MENSISDVLIASNFSFCHYYRTMDGHTYGTLLPFSREKVLQNDAENKLICGNAVACTKYGSGTPPDYELLLFGKINWEYFKVINFDVTIATEF